MGRVLQMVERGYRQSSPATKAAPWACNPPPWMRDVSDGRRNFLTAVRFASWHGAMRHASGRRASTLSGNEHLEIGGLRIDTCCSRRQVFPDVGNSPAVLKTAVRRSLWPSVGRRPFSQYLHWHVMIMRVLASYAPVEQHLGPLGNSQIHPSNLLAPQFERT
ncbi:hypothetical protein OH77DRAFT_103791 [Trametes cingulata]|nr:hypothetical protein OH77DRAFT_103791 [Trametes cingulata]